MKGIVQRWLREVANRVLGGLGYGPNTSGEVHEMANKRVAASQAIRTDKAEGKFY